MTCCTWEFYFAGSLYLAFDLHVSFAGIVEAGIAILIATSGTVRLNIPILQKIFSSREKIYQSWVVCGGEGALHILKKKEQRGTGGKSLTDFLFFYFYF